MSRQGLASYQVDADGLPVMSMLELARYRRFVTLRAAARALNMGAKTLRFYECGALVPSPKNRAAIERVFGLSWGQLNRPAPRTFVREKRT